MKKPKLKSTNPGQNPKGRNYVANYERQRVTSVRQMCMQALELATLAGYELENGNISDYDDLMCEAENRAESILFAINSHC